MSEQADREKENEVARLTEALLAGQKIEAIKIYRERTGCGLKEAKDEIEALEANLRVRHPEKFSSAGKKAGGCAGMLLAAITTAVCAVAVAAILLR